MSLINFLNAKLKPSVESDAVCEDGYSIANLIAEDVEQLNRGFMAFPVIKPPIEIMFEFPKAIDLKVIKIWNTNGALRSTAFEVHGKYEGIWERVANVRDISKGADTVTFCYQSDYSSRSEKAAEQLSSEIVFFFRSANTILSNTTNLKIVIKGTEKCPPVLRKVQVWGLPARSLDKADRELVRTIWNEVTNPPHLAECGKRSPTRSVVELNNESTLKIPEEFLDTITWELMVFPTTLPSGKVVDQSTIDKYAEVEAKWGRLPSDPFTGLEFTAHRKAILNLALKARIEKFLMENAEHFKTVPRSLGSTKVRRSKNRHVSQFANLSCQYSHPAEAGTYSSLTTVKKAMKHGLNYTSLSSYAIPEKRTKFSGTTTATRADGSYFSENTFLNISSGNYKSATATCTTSSISIQPNSTIDQAMEQALQKITRFTRLPAETKPANCISCKSEEFSYEIRTCKHLVCRSCLVQLIQQQMCLCKTSFRNSDVERYHKL